MMHSLTWKQIFTNIDRSGIHTANFHIASKHKQTAPAAVNSLALAHDAFNNISIGIINEEHTHLLIINSTRIVTFFNETCIY